MGALRATHVLFTKRRQLPARPYLVVAVLVSLVELALCVRFYLWVPWWVAIPLLGCYVSLAPLEEYIRQLGQVLNNKQVGFSYWTLLVLAPAAFIVSFDIVGVFVLIGLVVYVLGVIVVLCWWLALPIGLVLFVWWLLRD
jgi:hypothetical protein